MAVTREIKRLVIHCSASDWGNAIDMHERHVAKGWRYLGYHRIVSNGQPRRYDGYWPELDGQIMAGRSLNHDHLIDPYREIGAHVKGLNFESVGVCLVGRTRFTKKQLLSTKLLVWRLVEQFGLRERLRLNGALADRAVVGHCECYDLLNLPRGKTCPNIPMDAFCAFLWHRLTVGDLMDAIDEHTRKIYEGDATWKACRREPDE